MSEVPRGFTGACHCGALGFTFGTDRPVAQWSVRACQCRFCRRHDAATTSDPSGRLAFEVHEPDALVRYRFGLKTADFLLCRRCGVYLGAQVRTGQGAFGIINTRALTAVPEGLPAAAAADYAAEGASERVARRTVRWTPLEAIV
jgi:hypothetical protein